MVENVVYLPEEKKLQIKLDLCQWKQANYDESQPEMQEGLLIFTDVESFQIVPFPFLIDCNEILEVKAHSEEGTIEFILAGTVDVGKVSIVAKNIIWDPCFN